MENRTKPDIQILLATRDNSKHVLMYTEAGGVIARSRDIWYLLGWSDLASKNMRITRKAERLHLDRLGLDAKV